MTAAEFDVLPEQEQWFWFQVSCWNCGRVPKQLPAHYLCDRCRKEEVKT